EAVAADPLDRRSAEPGAEQRVAEGGELGEWRGHEVGPLAQLGLAAQAGELVPGADGEAVVAAVDAVAEERPQPTRDRALVLDRQVADAAPGVEAVRGREGAGRAGVEAAAAGAAAVGLGRVR